MLESASFPNVFVENFAFQIKGFERTIENCIEKKPCLEDRNRGSRQGFLRLAFQQVRELKPP